MPAQTHRFKIGAFEGVAINDGDIDMFAAVRFFHNAPPAELEMALRQHHIETENLVIPSTCLLVDTGQHRILVDTGSGKAFRSELGWLVEGLAAEGIPPESIDVVILSHGHWDHVGGNTNSAGQSAFQNARFFIARGEWEQWTDAAPIASASDADYINMLTFMRNSLLAIQPQVTLVEPECEIVPGVCLIPAPGHTRNHCAVEFASGTTRLLCVLDTMNHPLHIEHPEWSPQWDVLPEQSTSTRQALCARANGALVHSYHFPFPGLGYILPDGQHWRWQPI
jgi:glyoxylase-like metal-dependent hydrolase (beta-lactamase superfamily II)